MFLKFKFKKFNNNFKYILKFFILIIINLNIKFFKNDILFLIKL